MTPISPPSDAALPAPEQVDDTRLATAMARMEQQWRRGDRLVVTQDDHPLDIYMSACAPELRIILDALRAATEQVRVLTGEVAALTTSRAEKVRVLTGERDALHNFAVSATFALLNLPGLVGGSGVQGETIEGWVMADVNACTKAVSTGISDLRESLTALRARAEKAEAALEKTREAFEEVWPFYEGEHYYDHPCSVRVRALIEQADALTALPAKPEAADHV